MPVRGARVPRGLRRAGLLVLRARDALPVQPPPLPHGRPDPLLAAGVPPHGAVARPRLEAAQRARHLLRPPGQKRVGHFVRLHRQQDRPLLPAALAPPQRRRQLHPAGRQRRPRLHQAGSHLLLRLHHRHHPAKRPQPLHRRLRKGPPGPHRVPAAPQPEYPVRLRKAALRLPRQDHLRVRGVLLEHRVLKDHHLGKVRPLLASLRQRGYERRRTRTTNTVN